MDDLTPEELAAQDAPAQPEPQPANLAPLAFEEAAPAPAPVKKPNRVFFGRFGLRAGWGIAIYLVFYVILGILGGIFAVAATGSLKEAMAARAHNQAHPNEPKVHFEPPFVPSLVIVNDGIPFIGILGVCWFFSRAERRKLGAYGIGKSRFFDVFPGAFWGLAMLSILVFLLKSLHLLVFDGRALHRSAILTYGFAWLVAFLMVGFAEEYLFRGYIFFATERGIFGLAEHISKEHTRLVAFWLAATIMSLIFGAAHLGNGGENALGIFQVVLVGFVFSYTLWRTGSLWWAIGFHATWDWAQSFLYGVADSGNVSVGRLFVTHPTGSKLLSGGVDGPEGSVLCIPIMLLVLVVVHFTTKPGAQPPLEQEPRPQEPSPAIA